MLEILGLEGVDFGQRVLDAYALLAVFIVATVIPLTLVYSRFIVRRVSLIALVSIIGCFYLAAFILSLVLIRSGLLDADSAILGGVLLSLILTAAVTILVARILNPPEKPEPVMDGLSFAEKRRQRRGEPTSQQPASVADTDTPDKKQPAQPSRQQKDAPLRIRRDDDAIWDEIEGRN